MFAVGSPSSRTPYIYTSYNIVSRTTIEYSKRDLLIEGPYINAVTLESASKAIAPLRAAC